MFLSNLHIELATVIGAILTSTKLFFGIRLKTRDAKIKNIELFEKLGYDSDRSKKDLIRSEVFNLITKKTLDIHKINLIFNAYDPRRLLLIYKEAPGFIKFSDIGIIKPRRITNRCSRLLMLLVVSLQAVMPFLSYIYFRDEIRNVYVNLALIIISILFLLYSITQFLLLWETEKYYVDKKINDSNS